MKGRSWSVLSGSGLLALGLFVMAGCSGDAPQSGIDGQGQDKRHKEIAHAVAWPDPCSIPVPENYEGAEPGRGGHYSLLGCARFVDDVRELIWGNERIEEWKRYELAASGGDRSPSAEQVDLIIEALYGTGDWLEVYVQHDRNYCNILKQVSATLYGTKTIESEAKANGNKSVVGVGECKIRLVD